MTNYGLKISQLGYDAKTASPKDLVFSSEFWTTAIAVQGTASKNGDSGDRLIFTIEHGLSFIPFVLAYMNSSYYPNHWEWCPVGDVPGITGNWNQVYDTDIRVDSTDFVLRVYLGNGNNDTITVRYFLLNADI